MDHLIRQPLAAIEQVQNEKLRAMLDLCARGHPYYRRVWSEAKIDVGLVQTVADLERLPLTHKSALMADPESFRLNLPDLPLHERALWEIIYTTGSTADPTPIYNTTHDYNAYLFQSQRVAGISDIRETDVIANLFPLTPAPMGAFVRSASNAYAAGAAIFAALPGASYGDFDVRRPIDEAVRLIELHRATVLWGVPSFIRRLLLRAIELRADFKTVRMCAITGEASSPAMREELRRCLRELGSAGTLVFDRYGSTELGAFAQCREEGDWHNPTPELQYHEVVDPDSGRRLPDGDRGALAVTHLNRRGTILIRFIVGDIVSIDHRRCPVCGRTSERVVGPVVRAKDLVKVRGMLINPAVLLSTLQSIPGIEEFQVVVARENQTDPLSMDELVVRIAGADRDVLAETVIARTRDAVRVRPRIEFVDAKDIYDAAWQTKAVRFVGQAELIAMIKDTKVPGAETILKFYEQRGYRNSVGTGQNPAVVVIDFSNAFTRGASQFPGGDFAAELAQTRRLLAGAREHGVPVFYTTIAYADPERDSGFWGKKVPWLSCCKLGSEAVAIDPVLEPKAQELVIVKGFPSAFFSTDLHRELQARRIDTIVISGCTTSVCVRATAVDAMQHSYHTIVAEEAVGDFDAALHAVHLRDLDARYADVVPVDEILAYLRSLPTDGRHRGTANER